MKKIYSFLITALCLFSLPALAQNTCNLHALFTNDSLQSPVIHFTNQSTGTAPGDSVLWTFGDGTASHDLNPTHTFPAQGSYRVCLHITRPAPTPCTSEYCKTIVIAQHCDIHVGYTHHADSVNPRKVYFTNTTPSSTPATALWNFGDGTTSTTWNAVHEYAHGGRYYVCLTVHRGDCVATRCDSLTVIAPAPVANGPCMQLYPNPAHDRINAILMLNAPVMIHAYIYNTSNLMVAHKEQQGVTGANTISIGIGTLPTGIYTMKLVWEGHSCSSTFLKQ